ncbi:homeobox protein NANOG [Anolis carolinensis]|uniref:Homeobox domain-containing protein n=1 Tax=Anolis carolinensis TaxID=28377 RepID=G1KQY2_ANOCA|nr:PREDICTED: homeobox protein NANOG [Anolis carolinensis]|eukprot:XP_003216891.2 PREDICTED: homeobox protein NANOG [Anolis carolinensis]
MGLKAPATLDVLSSFPPWARGGCDGPCGEWHPGSRGSLLEGPRPSSALPPAPGSPREAPSLRGAPPPEADSGIKGPQGPSPPSGMGFDDYYVYPSGQRDAAAHYPEGFPARESLGGGEEEEEKEPRSQPDDSPQSYSSGTHTFYTPDSATSPNGPPSPQSTSQKLNGENNKGKKVKTRAAFSQKQLQILHHRFQNQKYLSPQQIRELAAALDLTYKQIKTWFQNQRMKFKRTQKESLWLRKGMCPPQNGFLQMNPNYHQGYGVGESRNIHALAGLHENFTSNQFYANNQNYTSDHQIYGNPQNLYPIANSEDGSFFGKATGASFNQQAVAYNGQQAVGYISQQKINFFHGFPTNMEYATVKTEDGYPFPNMSTTEAGSFPSSSGFQIYQLPLQTQGAQSNC